MSVLIKGMEMPKHCWQCPFHDDVDECILLNQSCMVVWGESKRLEDCPIVEVPTPHGRLIDADAYCEFCKFDCHWRIGDDPSCEFCHMPNAPTIIESEGEDESR